MNEPSRTRALYSRIVAGDENGGSYDAGSLSSAGRHGHQDGSESEDSISLLPRVASQKRRAKIVKRMPTTPSRPRYLPTARRFWADFTLGFADGLTVPFALTAGLSSLGQTDTVVYAGLAEVSAGCISMGIGGYLSARQSLPTTPDAAYDEDDEDDEDDASDDIEASLSDEGHEKRAVDGDVSLIAARYLAPLSLPDDLHRIVMAHVASLPSASGAILAADSRRKSGNTSDEFDESGYSYDKRPAHSRDSDNTNDGDRVWPVASGLSVALGYLIGGLLPLWPYFFVTRVGDGLRWSFAICIIALFFFGFIRDFALDHMAEADSVAARKTSARQLSWRKQRVPWRRLWKSTFEGLQMVILGGIAAITAVLCVRMFESGSS